MSEDQQRVQQAEQAVRQLGFERDYAESHVGRLFVQNQHQQQMIERLTAICEQHGIDPNTGEKVAPEKNGAGDVERIGRGVKSKG